MDTIPVSNGYVYLLHFEEPISPKHTAQHYIGHAEDLAARIQTQQLGRRRSLTGCARIVEVAHERGIGFRVVRVWLGGYELERQLKRRHAGPRLCPICNATVRPGLFELTARQIDEALVPF